MSLKGKKFEIFQAATQDKIDTCNNILLNDFDEDILMLLLQADFTKSKYPKLHEFYTKHCISRTYYFHVFKCSELDCPWHEALRYGEISSFGEPLPKEKTDSSITYIQGSDPSKKFLPSKLENPTKCNHGMQFTPTVQTALKVGITVKCSECCKLCVIYAKIKLTNANMVMKHIFNKFQYVCGTVFHNMPIDERNRDTLILELLHCRENLSCMSPIEIPYYSCKIFLKICYHCGSNKRLLPSDPVFYP